LVERFELDLREQVNIVPLQVQAKFDVLVARNPLHGHGDNNRLSEYSNPNTVRVLRPLAVFVVVNALESYYPGRFF